ncbi:DEAD/DEAH box helicase family protein [Vibrio sp. MED222]|uniref:DEAD/DEAH box helicase family protein n=1 Tax=Vibrio sp. MED222 TaxID=314290 RepID=UPI000068A849|nr:DEAD/DEAH box helicase family protein [Vibrio sp. MED222]EAQ54715.1 type I site-specific deoxyribonuclease chain R [Vibrio sp. MED222]
MSNVKSSLNIGLLDNGSHSLTRGYEIWKEWEKTDNPWLLKEAVIWVHHGIELLLKQLLVQSNEFLVFQNVNKAVERLSSLRKRKGMAEAALLDLFDHDEGVMSVGFKDVIKRATKELKLNELSEKEPLRILIDDLSKYRNKIVHFSIEINVTQVSTLLYDILDPLLALLSREVMDENFKKKVLPEIIRSAKPIHSYVERNRDKIVQHALKVTHDSVANNHLSKVGIVEQVTGSGLSNSLVDYILAITKHTDLYSLPILIIVDRADIAYQLNSLITENFQTNLQVGNSINEYELTLKSGDCNITITTIQNIISKNLKISDELLLVGFQLSRIPELFESLLPNSTRILFTSLATERAIEFYGEVIGKYSYYQAIEDHVLVPLNLEKQTSLFDSVQLIQPLFRSFETATVPTSGHLQAIAEQIIRHTESQVYLRKAIVLVRDINSAEILLNLIYQIRPKWGGIESSNNTVNTISTKKTPQDRETIILQFQDNQSPLSILIGTSAFLIDNERLQVDTAYVTSPVSLDLRYKLVAQVSRPHKENVTGQIVDFVDSDWSLEP